MVTGYDEEELAGRHEGFCLLKEFKARGQAEAFMGSLHIESGSNPHLSGNESLNITSLWFSHSPNLSNLRKR